MEIKCFCLFRKISGQFTVNEKSPYAYAIADSYSKRISIVQHRGILSRKLSGQFTVSEKSPYAYAIADNLYSKRISIV